MRLESAKAVLRVRRPFEAMDLGLLLLRSLAKPAAKALLLVVVPLQGFILLALSLLSDGWLGLPLGLVTIVWLQPLFDRVWLLLLGRGLFGPAPGPRELWRELWINGRRGLLGDLVWRRPDAPRRTLYAAVALLEGLTGAAAARRRSSLVSSHQGTVWSMWLAGVTLTISTAVGVAGLVTFMLPDEASWTGNTILGFEEEGAIARLVILALLVSANLIEPLYVAAGFGLYINGRTIVEGWDIELVFRKLARRLEGGASLAVLLGLLLAAGASTAPAHADADLDQNESRSALTEELRLPAPPLPVDDEAHAAMKRVVSRPELQRERTEERWRLRQWVHDWHKHDDDEPARGPSPWLLALGEALAGGMQLLLWGLVLVLAALLLYFVIVVAQRVRGARSAPRATLDTVTVVHLPEGSREISPLDALERARSLAAAGRHDEALTLLYVGMIAALTLLRGVALPARATEGECLRIVRRAGLDPAQSQLFAEVVELRQWVAYAHGAVDRRRLDDLCMRFAGSFWERT